MRPFRLRLSLLLTALVLSGPPAACADDFRLDATFGIGGRYRAGTWTPVTARVVNGGALPVRGQIQALALPNGGSPRILPVFARPVVVAPGVAPQSFSLLVRDLDPTRDTLAVQLTDENGGQVRARTTGSAALGISGLPVGEQDLLLVGFADDPAAWTFLNGQKWGLRHAPEGPTAAVTAAPLRRFYSGSFPRTLPPGARPPRFVPPRFVPPRVLPPAFVLPAPSVQIAAAQPAALPDKPAGYSGVDAFLLRADAPLDALSEAQANALQGWVAGGGELVVCGGSDPARWATGWLREMLPLKSVGAARVVTTPTGGAADALSLRAKADARVLARAADGLPLVVAGAWGAGRVVVIAYDPTTLPFARWSGTGEKAFWSGLLTASRLSSLLGSAARRQESGGSGGFYGWGPTLASAVTRAPALDAPGISVVGLFLLAYVLVLVPLNYLILKRLDRREWAWLTIPILVLLFAAGTYGVGYASKGGRTFVNRAVLVETTAGQRRAGAYGALGLFSPRRTTYDIALADPSLLATVPAPASDPFPGYRRPGGGRPAPELYGAARVVETGAGVAVEDVAVNMWAMRALDVQTSLDLGGPIDAALAPTGPHGDILCTLTNHSVQSLSGCALLYNGQWQTLDDFAPGSRLSAVLSALLPLPPVSSVSSGSYRVNSRFQIPTGGGAAGGEFSPFDRRRAVGPETGDVHKRMQAALADYARALGREQNFYGGRGAFGGIPAFSPRRDEAVFVGWTTGRLLPGPLPRVNGRDVSCSEIGLVVVHIPVR